MSTTRENSAGGDSQFRAQVETIRSLLDENNRALEALGDLEADLNHLRSTSERIRRPVLRLVEDVLLMAEECNILTDHRHPALFEVILNILDETRTLFRHVESEGNRPLAVALDHDEALDATLVGGKAAELARLGREMEGMIPPGFVLTTAASALFLRENRLEEGIRLLLQDLEISFDPERRRARTETLRTWVEEGEVPAEVRSALAEEVGRVPGVGSAGWAVRSSAVCEGGRHSFAGLFASELAVAPDRLLPSYLRVLASRFLDRAVSYRIHRGIREVETPMAVLFQPMIEPSASGILHTFDPEDAAADVIRVSAVAGLGDGLARGTVSANDFRLSREAESRLLDAIPAAAPGAGSTPSSLSEPLLRELGARALEARERMGHDLEMEWAIDGAGRLYFLQARRAPAAAPVRVERGAQRGDPPLFQGGYTICTGRAEGPVFRLSPGDSLDCVPRGAVLLADQPRPELSPVLPRLAALLVREGNPLGHLATLAREFAVPSLFRIGEAATRLEDARTVTVDAASRVIYEGSRWAGLRERVMARTARPDRPPRSGPLYDRILALHLSDPDAPEFKASHCESIHDALRFMHETSLRSVFAFGDKQKHWRRRRSLKLATDLPRRFLVIALDRPPPSFRTRSIEPAAVESVPFQAFWRGFSDVRLARPDRWKEEMMGIPRDLQEAALGGDRGPRRRSAPNYILVAEDYLNFNARFAYHYSMVDASVGPGTENNHLYFTFRSGGACDENRVRRAVFLENVLRHSHFDVDRRADVVFAWIRRYPEADCRRMLELLGRLLVCSRQLDAVLRSDASVKTYATHFLAARYDAFA